MPSSFQQRPALKTAIGISVGILLSESLGLSLILTTALLVSFIVAGVILFMVRKKEDPGTPLYSFFLIVILLALGAWKFALDESAVLENPLPSYADSHRLVLLFGYVQDPVHKKPNSYQTVMSVKRISTEEGVDRVEGDVLLSLPKEKFKDSFLKTLRVGTWIEVEGQIRRPRKPRNPGDFDAERFFLLRGVHASMYVQDPADLRVLDLQPGDRSLLGGIRRLRSTFASSIDKTVGGLESSFLKGILLGDRSDIPEEVKTSFINSGVVHILAVSGLHVGLVALIFMSIFTVLRLRRPWNLLLTIVSLFFYMLLTGSAPSVVRATIMATIILFGLVVQKKPDVFNSLGVSAILIYFIDAKQLFNPGFQLSFAAVASILYFYPSVSRYLDYFPEKVRSRKSVVFVWKLFAVSLAAQIGTVPFTIAYFERISLVSLAANLFVIPAVGIALGIGFTLLSFSLLSSWIAGVYGAAEKLLLWVVLEVVEFSSALPFAYFLIPGLSFLGFLIFYTSAVLVFNFREKALRGKLVITLLLLGNLALLPGVFGGSPPLRATVLDVGQGDALLVQFPSGKNLLVDCGPKVFDYDAGEKILVPFLKRTVTKIDALVVTHPHSDHLGGVLSILQSIPVERVYDAGHVAESKTYQAFRARLLELKIPYSSLRAGSTIPLSDEVRIFVLHPTREFVYRNSQQFLRDFNNSSVVLKVLYGKNSMLLTGDAEEPSEVQMLHFYDGFLKSDVIKAGHHGSVTSSSETFVQTVNPRFAAISVGAFNKFGHPSEDILTRYRSIGAQVSRTDLEGAIVFEMDGNSLRKVKWR